MTVLGATGHQSIPPEAVTFVEEALARTIAAAPGPVGGVCSLAAGADQLFAEAIRARGGTIVVVVPCDGYEDAFAREEDRRRYERLLGEAKELVRLENPRPSEQAFLEAGKRVVDMSDRVLAVWDGQPAHGVGGTADAVAYARKLGKDLEVIWPEGVTR